MIFLAPHLRVYYSVTVVDVSVRRIQPDGTSAALPTPPSFRQVGRGYWPGNILIARLTPEIDSYMDQSNWAADCPIGTRFEWTIRWSENSLSLEHSDTVVWEKRDAHH